MKRSFYSSLSASALLLGTITLVGCGGASSFSNPGSAGTTPPSTPQSVAGVPIKGSVFGGHAPISGSHVYLLQPGTTGYGSLATSLITTGTANVSDPNVPVGAQYVVTDSNGNFNTGDYTCVVGRPAYLYSWGGTPGGTINNNNIVQLATLGNCPSSGNFYTAGTGNGALNFIYMNEVSTVATAYTFQPFTLVTHNDAWHIGTTNTTQGLLGIANAASTAAQLYNIQGGTTISTSGDGEGHLANFQTQLNGVSNQGNGVVPQATIDSLANIVADCIDSVPTALGVVTTQCAALFKVATNDGTTATAGRPVDTGTAAINIARFPAGNNSSNNVDATYAADIYALQGSGTTPYVPQLTSAPHDWTLPIYYPVAAVAPAYGTATNSTLGAAESVAVDNIGQVWITAQTDTDIVRWSPLGAQNSFQDLGYIAGYVSIDGSNNAWTGNANDAPTANGGNGGTGTPIFQAGNNGVFTTQFGSGYYQAYTVVTNNAGDAFFFAGNSSLNGNYDMWEYNPSGTLSGGSPFDINPTTTTTTGPVTQNLTITAASETNSGGTYTYSFNYTYAGGTPPTLLAVGDTVPLTLANDAGTGGHPVAATGWQNLTSVTVASVSGTSFTATGTTATTNSNDGAGAATTAAINITAATETNTGGGNPTFTYTFHFTNVGTPGVALADGDTVPLSLTDDPGTGTVPVAATGWRNLTTVTAATVNNAAGTFTATGGTTGTANITTTNTVSANTNGPDVTLNITAANFTRAGATFTYTFTFAAVGSTPLKAGDTVHLTLTDAPAGLFGTAASGWGGLGNVTVATVNSATNPTSFTATGTTVVTDSTGLGGGNGATGTGTYPINGATGTGTYTYTNANGATGSGSYVYTGTITTTTPGALPAGDNVGHGAIDSDGDLWLTAETPGNTIARVTPTGTPLFTSIVTAEQPEFPAIDSSGNAWIAIQETASQVDIVSPTGSTTVLTAAGTGALMTSTFGAAVDGNGNVWFANRAGNYGAVGPTTAGQNTIFVINGGVLTPGTAQTAISPPTNYVPEAQYPAAGGTESPILNGPLNLAIDPSGNVWITNYTGGGMVELVGAAAPVATPLSVAAANNQLGTKP